MWMTYRGRLYFSNRRRLGLLWNATSGLHGRIRVVVSFA